MTHSPTHRVRRDPVQFDLARAARHVARALLLRCPNCGGGGLFKRWVHMESTCSRCHLKLDRGEADYFIGGYVINFVTAEFAVAAGALAAILLTWPDVPWNAVKWGLLALMVPLPVLTYPVAKTLWLAIDLVFRPVTWADLAGHGENAGADAPSAS
jgi:uncharacterized protein (DUF983 family)